MPETLIGLDVKLLAAWIVVLWTIIVIFFAVVRTAPWRAKL
jgi:hypothetical protein